MATGINGQLSALARLPRDIEALCTQLQALQQQCDRLQQRQVEQK